jgi:hypothetical protein
MQMTNVAVEKSFRNLAPVISIPQHPLFLMRRGEMPDATLQTDRPGHEITAHRFFR